MKKSIILIAMALIITVAGIYKIDSQAVVTYDSNNLTQFSDGVRYDTETNTIYTRGKIARWSVQKAERAFRKSHDKEFWLDNGLIETSKNYRCVKVKRIVYEKEGERIYVDI
jgi:hypothetical protein